MQNRELPLLDSCVMGISLRNGLTNFERLFRSRFLLITFAKVWIDKTCEACQAKAPDFVTFHKLAIPGPFFFIFVFSTIDRK